MMAAEELAILRAIGERFKREAHDIADDLSGRGADAANFLLDKEERVETYLKRGDVCIPPMMADVIHAMLLTFSTGKRGRPTKGSTFEARRLLKEGLSKEEIGRRLADDFSNTADNVKRRLRRQKVPPEKME
jgi:hypothetical protein